MVVEVDHEEFVIAAVEVATAVATEVDHEVEVFQLLATAVMVL